MAESNDRVDMRADIDEIKLSYKSFTAHIHLVETQPGWTMEIDGEDFKARSDHTGMLSVNNEGQPRISPDPVVMEDAIIKNLNDFMKAVRERSQPRVNSLDGLASIVLNNAVKKSMETGSVINL